MAWQQWSQLLLVLNIGFWASPRGKRGSKKVAVTWDQSEPLGRGGHHHQLARHFGIMKVSFSGQEIRCKSSFTIVHRHTVNNLLGRYMRPTTPHYVVTVEDAI